MNELKEWRDENGYSFATMGNMLKVSPSHICRVLGGTKTLSQSKIERLNKIIKMENLIKNKVPDILVIKWELDKFIRGMQL